MNVMNSKYMLTHFLTDCLEFLYQPRKKEKKNLTLILPTWTKWRAPTNASKWQMGFNSAFKGLSPVTRTGPATSVKATNTASLYKL